MARTGRPPKYNWDKLLRGSFRATRGTDFDCEPYVFGQQVRTAARKRGKTVRVGIVGETVTVTVGG